MREVYKFEKALGVLDFIVTYFLILIPGIINILYALYLFGDRYGSFEAATWRVLVTLVAGTLLYFLKVLALGSAHTLIAIARNTDSD